MSRKKTGLAEEASTAQAPKRTRTKPLDLAAVFHLTPEMVADLEAVAAEAETAREDILVMAGTHAAAALKGLCTSMIEDAQERTAERVSRLAQLKDAQSDPNRFQPRTDILRADD